MTATHSTPSPQKSKGKAKSDKPAKPHKDYPLFAHNNGQWSKKVRGKIHHFGKWDNPQAAIEKWITQKDDLLAGRTPRVHDPDALTVERLCNLFLDSRQRLVESGELSTGTVNDYLADSKIVTKVLGRTTLVEQLRPDDFAKLRSAFAKGVGIKTLEGCIARARAIFNYADKNGFLERSLSKLWGTEFNKPKKTALDKHRNQTVRMFEPSEIKTLIKSASPQVAAQILLGINCAMGPTDLAKLRFDQVKGEWLNVPRSKTGVMRRVWLWPETRKAIKEAIGARPEPKDPSLTEVLFITKYGRDWSHQGCLSSEFGKLRDRCEIKGNGKTFYTLRHCFQTIADETKDFVAVSSCMGHASTSISDHYREKIGDDRLKAVSVHVRQWLFEGVAQ